MRIRYTAQAFAEREAIFDYLEERNPRAARDVVGLIARRITELGEQPQLGHKSDRPGIYALWIRPRAYRVFYWIDGSEVVILHIRHTSRRHWRGEANEE